MRGCPARFRYIKTCHCEEHRRCDVAISVPTEGNGGRNRSLRSGGKRSALPDLTVSESEPVDDTARILCRRGQNRQRRTPRPSILGTARGLPYDSLWFYKIHLADEGLSGLMWVYGGQKSRRSLASHQHEVLYLINSEGIVSHQAAGERIHAFGMMRCKGGLPPLMIYTLTRDDMPSLRLG